MTKIGIIVQCRDLATRYKRKTVREFFQGESILGIIIDKLKTLNYQIVVATTDDSVETVGICNLKNVDYFIGSNENVAERLYKCAKKYNFYGFFRVCADNPFIQLSLLHRIEEHIPEDYDYITYKDSMKRHEGFFVEYVKRTVLYDTITESKKWYDLEHVTPFVIRQPKRYKQKILRVPRLMDLTPIRLTVDTRSDFLNAQDVYKHTGYYYTWGDILEYIYENPALFKRMKKNIEENMK